MQLSVDQRDQTAVVAITGSVDAATATQLTGFLSQQIGAGHSRLVADLGRVDYISSAGLRALLATVKEARYRGGDLRLAAAQADVQQVLEMSGFTTILKLYPTVADAVASFT